MLKKAKVQKDTIDRWLLTYSDLMNLLLIFFIILYAISQVDSSKYNQLAYSLREAFGTSASSTYIGTHGSSNSIIDLDSGSASTVIPDKLEDTQMEEVKKKIDEVVAKSGIDNSIEVTIKERGIEISIRDSLLFKSGSSDIEPKAKETIVQIGNILHNLSDNQIRVEGHTDNEPIRTTQYPSNWELSSARAVNVLRILIDESGIDPKMVSAIGYGEFRPKLPNTSIENKIKNRRVDIVVVKESLNLTEANN